ncbi:DNA topoisomerase III, partial [Paenibacillus validus]|nr:DNA topoisomerase III [Paenibacillus validus]
GACPRPGCGGHIIRGKRGYGCSAYKSGCKFVIWKEGVGAALTDAAVARLLKQGRTDTMQVLGGNGVAVEGRIVLRDPSTGELSVER